MNFHSGLFLILSLLWFTIIKKQSLNEGLLLILEICIAITLLLTALVALDIIGIINLTHPLLLSVWLLLLPHSVLVFYLGVNFLKSNQIGGGWLITLFWYFVFLALYLLSLIHISFPYF